MVQSFVIVSFVLRYGVQGGQTFESWIVFIDTDMTLYVLMLYVPCYLLVSSGSFHISMLIASIS
jgi:hypothetical protein